VVNQADDKTGSFETTKRREVTPVAVLFTAKHRSKGEIILLCQKKTQLNARAKMNAKASRLPLRRASLCAKKWNTFGKANMVPGRQSKQLPLVCPRRGERE
jgi:16S rRNA C1402 (ribose-2'-O) methylase RsmI